MAKLNTKIEINIQDIDKVKTLVEVLNKNSEQLPKELIKEINNIADCKTFEYDRDYFLNKGCVNVCVHADGYRIDNAISINPILKRIKVAKGKDIDFQFCNVTNEGSSILTIGDNTKTMKVPLDSRYQQTIPKITNDMKALCIGEFEWQEEAPYYNEDGALVEHTATRIVPWELCKSIYKKMAVIANKSIN